MKKLSSNDLELACIDELLDFAWQKAIKYRFDPFASRIHEEYLEMIKAMKKEIQSKGEECTK